VIGLFLGVSVITSTGTIKENHCLINDSTKFYNSSVESEKDGINITLNGTIGENGWYISCVNITFTVFGSHIENVWYKLNDEGWQLYTGHFILEICEDGIYIFCVKYEDNTGNITIECVDFKIDKTKPIIIEIIYEKIGKNRGKMTVICEDETSGINRTEFLLDFIPWFTDFDEPYEWIVVGHGPGCFSYCKVYDNAGNIAKPKIGIPPHDNEFKGLILYPEITEKTITFFAIFAFSRGLGYPWIGIHMFQWITYRNDFTGYIGKYWIDAVFHHT
jgi:hypothetical protein